MPPVKSSYIDHHRAKEAASAWGQRWLSALGYLLNLTLLV